MGNTKAKKINWWKLYHDSLNDAQKKDAKEKVMKALECSEPNFYYKMRNGDAGLKNFQRLAICNAYGVNVADFFPESDLVKPAKKKAKAA